MIINVFIIERCRKESRGACGLWWSSSKDLEANKCCTFNPRRYPALNSWMTGPLIHYCTFDLGF